MAEQNPLLIAIDGPSASGKGTLAKRIAAHYQMDHLDTGKLYRAVGQRTLHLVDDIQEAEDHHSEAAHMAVEIATSLSLNDILNAQNLSNEEVGKAASIVSAIPEVRKALLDFQRSVADSPNGAVLDGRDIGTVVCPHAHIKFFITASLNARADRRTKELQKQDKRIIREAVFKELEQRDARDMQRSTAPLKQTEDAYFIDTTDMNMDEVLSKATAIIDAFTSKSSG